MKTSSQCFLFSRSSQSLQLETQKISKAHQKLKQNYFIFVSRFFPSQMKLPAEFIEKFGTGVHVIDKQHKLLFELFSFLTAVKGNAIQFSNEILLGVFEYSLVQTHISTPFNFLIIFHQLHEQFEENLMQIHHVPSFFEHQREHQFYTFFSKPFTSFSRVLIEIISMTIQEMKQSSGTMVLEARMKRTSAMLFNWLVCFCFPPFFLICQRKTT